MTMTASRRARAIARGRYDFSSSSMPASTSTTSTISGRSFSFGDPEPIMSRRELIDYLECWNNGRYYEPPIPMAALTRAENVSPHHASAIGYKVKQLAKDFIPHRLLDRATFAAWARTTTPSPATAISRWCRTGSAASRG
jgi:capsid portal protein